MSICVFEMDAYSDTGTDYDDTSVSDLVESINTNLYLAEAYRAQFAHGLAAECLRAALAEWTRYAPLVTIYAGPALGTRLNTLAAEWGVTV